MKCVYLITFVFFSLVECSLYIVDRNFNKMVELIPESPYCYIFTDKKVIRSVVDNYRNSKVVKFKPGDEIDKFIEICNRKQLQTPYQGGFIYPGTRWCGPGDVAKNYTDLGNHKREDMCCREHDHCKNYIEGWKCKHNLCNKTPFTRSHCDCDDLFKQCLQNVRSETANTIGAIFFNVAQVICFKPKGPCNSAAQIEETCEYEFTISDKYIPSDQTIYYYRTKGEVVEKYFNRALKHLKIL